MQPVQDSARGLAVVLATVSLFALSANPEVCLDFESVGDIFESVDDAFERCLEVEENAADHLDASLRLVRCTDGSVDLNWVPIRSKEQGTAGDIVIIQSMDLLLACAFQRIENNIDQRVDAAVAGANDDDDATDGDDAESYAENADADGDGDKVYGTEHDDEQCCVLVYIFQVNQNYVTKNYIVNQERWLQSLNISQHKKSSHDLTHLMKLNAASINTIKEEIVAMNVTPSLALRENKLCLFFVKLQFETRVSSETTFVPNGKEPSNSPNCGTIYMIAILCAKQEHIREDTVLKKYTFHENILLIILRGILIAPASSEQLDNEDSRPKKKRAQKLLSDNDSLSQLLNYFRIFFTGNSSKQIDDTYCIGTEGCTFKIHLSENETLNVSEYVRTSDALEIINVVGHSLSLFSIMCISATALAFKQWRQDLSNKILLNMAAAILLNIPLFFIINYTTVDSDVTTCIIFGVVLHYSCLSCFCWMLVMSGLQLLRLVTVFGAKRITHLLLKVALFAWGAPLVPIVVLLSWDTTFYSADMEEWGFCFPRGIALTLTVRAPLYIILTINLVVFAVILCRIYMCCGWGKMEDLRRHGDGYRYSLNRTRTTVALFFLLGLPWTIGYLLYDPISSAYLFSITTSNQGVMLFVFFVLLDKKTRGYWKEAFRKLKSRKPSKSSVFSSKCKPMQAV